MKDYVDITPSTVMPDGKGASGKEVVLTSKEVEQVRENPRRLTKEGIQKKIEIWTRSRNAQCKAKYNAMLKRCEKIAPSGKTEEGEIIFSRDAQGNPNWVDVPLHPKPKEAKKEPKKGD